MALHSEITSGKLGGLYGILGIDPGQPYARQELYYTISLTPQAHFLYLFSNFFFTEGRNSRKGILEAKRKKGFPKLCRTF